jgi:hypothetical protein
MERYDHNGKFIVHHVTKEKPCWVCDAQVDHAHTNYCPNIKYLKKSFA